MGWWRKVALFAWLVWTLLRQTKYLFLVLWRRQGFICLKANLQLHSHSLTSAHFSPPCSCGKTINKVATVGAVGVPPAFPLAQAPRVEICSCLNSKSSAPLREDVCWRFASWRISQGRSATKRGYAEMQAAWAAEGGGGTPSPVRNPCVGFSVFFFLSICKVSALGQRG